jgi:hypothetical protein
MTTWRGESMSKATFRILATIALLGTACHGPASIDDESTAQGLGAGGRGKSDAGAPGNSGNAPGNSGNAGGNPGMPGATPGTAPGNAGGKCGVSHATYTTFNPAVGGCGQGNNPNGVNCNIYDRKDHVYISGGPGKKSGLPAGTYFFAVLVPGHQNGDFIDGHEGNLSDRTAGGTPGDLGTGDLVGNRTFTMDDAGNVSYGGTHATGTRDGHLIIDLAPFDDTANPGGEYDVAVCALGATGPCGCKYDNFKVKRGGNGGGTGGAGGSGAGGEGGSGGGAGGTGGMVGEGGSGGGGTGGGGTGGMVGEGGSSGGGTGGQGTGGTGGTPPRCAAGVIECSLSDGVDSNCPAGFGCSNGCCVMLIP